MYKHVKSSGPFMPLHLIKHSVQYEYKKGKWGLDKRTKNSLKVAIQANTQSLEGKYVGQMVDGAGVVNS